MNPKDMSRKELCKDLARLQRAIRSKGIPVLVILEGWENAGKGRMIQELIRDMDPRSFKVQVFDTPTDEEKRKPFLWRFWNRFPKRGDFAFFDRSYYQIFMETHLLKKGLKQDNLKDIYDLEQSLTQDGMLILKFFLVVGKEELIKRHNEVAFNPATAFRITQRDLDQIGHYDAFASLFKQLLKNTTFDFAPWHIVETSDEKKAAVDILRIVHSSLTAALEAEPVPAPAREEIDVPDLLSNIDLSLSIEREEYDRRIDDLQEQAKDLAYILYTRKIPTILVFEGWDAAGKGGAIKRLTREMDPRGYEVVPIAAPTPIEHQYHYLWRFFVHLPKTGHMTIFDRSWYGRLMVERVEGFARPDEWERAYEEINEFEEHLNNWGAIVLKFFIHIDSDTQLERFESREENEDKQYKITDEDWRNREKWSEYEEAINEMLWRTDISRSPWIIVEGNQKEYARIKVLETFIEAVKKRLKEEDS